jgi:hypothetical protein
MLPARFPRSEKALRRVISGQGRVFRRVGGNLRRFVGRQQHIVGQFDFPAVFVSEVLALEVAYAHVGKGHKATIAET